MGMWRSCGNYFRSNSFPFYSLKRSQHIMFWYYLINLKPNEEEEKEKENDTNNTCSNPTYW